MTQNYFRLTEMVRLPLTRELLLIMALHIRQGQFQGIITLDKEFKLSELADDTAIFMYHIYLRFQD